MGNAANFNLSLSSKKCPAQKETSIAAIDVNSDVKPRISFLGNFIAKSFSSNREVRIARKKTKAVIEKQRATRDAIAKAPNAGSFIRTGLPVSSVTPPGMVAEVANATVAISAATTEHDSEVLVSHSLPSLTRVLCVSVKICFGL